jgi:uncharacterized protein YndB with AHSA1/START domain
MDINWQGSIRINAPVEQVYRYLADFPCHCEWAKTLERMEQLRAGGSTGIGACYLTNERQAMQADRKPYERLTSGMRVKTMCEVRELTPERRIAWHAHTVPKAMGLYANLDFELAPTEDGGTLLTQHYHFHQPAPMVLMFKLMFARDLAAKENAQWEASLRNIKAILEQPDEVQLVAHEQSRRITSSAAA